MGTDKSGFRKSVILFLILLLTSALISVVVVSPAIANSKNCNKQKWIDVNWGPGGENTTREYGHRHWNGEQHYVNWVRWRNGNWQWGWYDDNNRPWKDSRDRFIGTARCRWRPNGVPRVR